MNDEIKVINGRTYKVGKWGAKTAGIHMAKLIKLLGPGIKTMFTGVFDISIITSILEVDNIEEVFDYLIKMTLSNTFIKEEGSDKFTRMSPDMFDHYYKSADDLEEFYQLVYFVLEANFKGFILGVKDKLKSKVEEVNAKVQELQSK